MSIMVRDLPVSERPRERLLQEGAAGLSNVELLAILLRTGTRQHSVLHLAEAVLARYKGKGLLDILQMGPADLASIHGIGAAKAATILAAVELGQRLTKTAAKIRDVIRGPEDAAAYAMPHFRYKRREHFAVLVLNRKNHVLAMPIVSIGSQSASIVHPREVFHAAIQHAAAALILLHNHPSGDPHPSKEDLQVTRRLMEAGKIMDIPVLDHIILGDNRYLSLREKGMLPA